jgi:hypothetical protein
LCAVGGVLVAIGPLFQWLKNPSLPARGTDFAAGRIGVAVGAVTVVAAVASVWAGGGVRRGLGLLMGLLGIGAVALTIWGFSSVTELGNAIDVVTHNLEGALPTLSSVSPELWVMAAGGVLAIGGGTFQGLEATRVGSQAAYERFTP